MTDAPFAVKESTARRVPNRAAIGYVLVLSAICLWSVNATISKIVVDSGGMSALRLAQVRATGAGLILFGVIVASVALALWLYTIDMSL